MECAVYNVPMLQPIQKFGRVVSYIGLLKFLMGTLLSTKAYYTQHTPYYKIKISN
jgi:hypothetical protein